MRGGCGGGVLALGSDGMSVVNKMLKDLEAREGEEKTHANYQPPVKKSQRLRIWVYGLVVAAVVVIAFALFTVPEKSPEPQSVKQQAAQTATGDMESVEEAIFSQSARKPAADPVTEKKAGSLLTRPISELVAESRAEKNPAPEKTEESHSTGSMRAIAQPTEEAETPIQGPEITESPASHFELTTTADSDKQTQNLRERIRLALAKPDKREAIALMGQLIDAEPENTAVRKKLAAILFAQGQTASARDMLIKTLQMSPADHSVRLMLARLYVQQGQPEAAATVLADADQYRPVSADLLAFRAAAAQEHGNYSAALSDYNQLAAMTPDQARWWLGVGISADKLGEGEVASRAYQQALSLRQLNSEVNQFMSQRISALSGGDNE